NRDGLNQALCGLQPYLVSSRSLGGLCVRGTPGPISNPVVKPDSAYGTRRVTARESRSPPKDLNNLQRPLAKAGAEALNPHRSEKKYRKQGMGSRFARPHTLFADIFSLTVHEIQ